MRSQDGAMHIGNGAMRFAYCALRVYITRWLMLAVLLILGAPASAAEHTVRVNTFPNAKALALQVGIAKGLFARQGLAVELEFTESSKAQRDGLMPRRKGSLTKGAASRSAGQARQALGTPPETRARETAKD